MDRDLNLELKTKIAERRALLVPGVSNALAARLVEDMGFEATYITGAGVTNTFFGMPDLGFIGLSDLVAHTTAVRQAVNLPLMVDIDTGFGSALNVHHTVRAIERAGANGIQIEDQVMPKRCGHFNGKEVVSVAEAAMRVRAAVEARRDPNFQIIARTDARAATGLDDALERGQRFVEEGADVIFIEAPESLAEVETVMAAFDRPQLLNLVIGGKTPIVPLADAERMRVGMVLYANIALQSAVAGMRQALGRLKQDGRCDESSPGVASFKERQALVRKSYFDALDARYSLEDDRDA
jgi:2-methylisocitrate lyase-like PEP mutase family enzyme